MRTERLSTVRHRDRVQTVNNDPLVTVQADGPRTEILEILKKYKEVGIVDHLREVDLVYKDVSEFEDFRDVMVQSVAAEASFMKLAPQIRDVFQNDVSRWLDAAHDADKLEALRPQLEKLGVMKPKDVAPPVP